MGNNLFLWLFVFVKVIMLTLIQVPTGFPYNKYQTQVLFSRVFCLVIVIMPFYIIYMQYNKQSGRILF